MYEFRAFNILIRDNWPSQDCHSARYVFDYCRPTGADYGFEEKTMKTPTYAWVCHSCNQTNIPGIGACNHCGFPAVASAKDIDAAPGHEANPVLTKLGGYLLLVIVAGPITFILQFGAMDSAVWLLPLAAVGGLVAWGKSALARSDDR